MVCKKNSLFVSLCLVAFSSVACSPRAFNDSGADEQGVSTGTKTINSDLAIFYPDFQVNGLQKSNSFELEAGQKVQLTGKTLTHKQACGLVYEAVIKSGKNLGKRGHISGGDLGLPRVNTKCKPL